MTREEKITEGLRLLHQRAAFIEVLLPHGQNGDGGLRLDPRETSVQATKRLYNLKHEWLPNENQTREHVSSEENY